MLKQRVMHNEVLVCNTGCDATCCYLPFSCSWHNTKLQSRWFDKDSHVIDIAVLTLNIVTTYLDNTRIYTKPTIDIMTHKYMKTQDSNLSYLISQVHDRVVQGNLILEWTHDISLPKGG